MVHDNQEGDRPHNLESADYFLFVIATGASDAMSVIERPGWMRWNAGRRARCGKSERNRGEGRRPRRLLSFPMGGGTVPRGQFHHVRAMPCHRRMLLRSGVRQETASRSGATNGRQESGEIHRLTNVRTSGRERVGKYV